MFWFLIPVIALIAFAASIDRKRKKINNHLLQSTHPDSHAANSSSFESGESYGGGE